MGPVEQSPRKTNLSGRDMRCPKCDHEQNNTVECDVCGVIFSRYQKIQEKRKEAEEQKKALAGKSTKATTLLQVLLLVLVVAGTTYYFTAKKPTSAVNEVPAKVAEAPSQASIPAEVPAEKIPQSAQKQPPDSSQRPPQGNTIERAKNATVSIETPWGTGSGFFVNKNYIVTNRHVVSFDEKKLAELRDRVEKNRRFIELEEKKINGWKQDYRKIPNSPERSQLAMIIEQAEENLQKVLPMHEEFERKLDKLDRKIQPSDIKIILADGSAHAANYLLVSSNYDLALMSLFSGERSFIDKPPSGASLHQGDKVYAIGSPVGLRHTVTSGIFSGYRAQGKDGQVYLQTDAPINPGNSGGPIIDEYGYARGVTTMILQNTEGIGFAIPIEKVFEEFRSSLY